MGTVEEKCTDDLIAEKGTREFMSSYWRENSAQGSLQEMMLDSEADSLGAEEGPEVLSLLPSILGKDVVELGAGIGRFTCQLAETARSVVAVDFMETFIQKNQEANGHYGNIQFIEADATTFNQPANSCDVIFSNWLLMYMTDEEVRDLFTRQLAWLREGGYLFFRESCFHQSGNSPRRDNPTQYRDPAVYNSLYQSVSAPNEDGKQRYGFELVFSRSIQAYVKHKSNPNQICWLLKKEAVEGGETHGYASFQEFLDNQQYNRNGILRYERIFGKHFVSTGGRETTENFVKLLDLQPGQKVLDVGSGIGGSAFYMAEKFDVNVLGIDLSANMVAIGWERLNEIKDTRVQFEVADATKREFEEGSFDVIYSRDTILHIKDKKALFTSFLRWLKPGGRVLISDYCCSDGDHSPQFKEYVAQRGYNLLSPLKYGQVLEEAGFCEVNAMDKTDLFVEVLKVEVARTESIKDSFIQEFNESDYHAIVDGWKSKLDRCALGDQRWGVFVAYKPK